MILIPAIKICPQRAVKVRTASAVRALVGALMSNGLWSQSKGLCSLSNGLPQPAQSDDSWNPVHCHRSQLARCMMHTHRPVAKLMALLLICYSCRCNQVLPPFPEPKRGKLHWDCLLEEMKWMATEFTR